jgi:hypothetical protein
MCKGITKLLESIASDFLPDYSPGFVKEMQKEGRIMTEAWG